MAVMAESERDTEESADGVREAHAIGILALTNDIGDARFFLSVSSWSL